MNILPVNNVNFNAKPRMISRNNIKCIIKDADNAYFIKLNEIMEEAINCKNPKEYVEKQLNSLRAYKKSLK